MNPLIEIFNSIVTYADKVQPIVETKKLNKIPLSYNDRKFNDTNGMMIGVMEVDMIDENRNEFTLKFCSFSGKKVFYVSTGELNFFGYEFVNKGFKKGTRVYNIKRKCFTDKTFDKHCAAIKMFIALTEYLIEHKELNVKEIFLGESCFRKIRKNPNAYDLSTKLNDENFYNRLIESFIDCKQKLYYIHDQ